MEKLLKGWVIGWIAFTLLVSFGDNTALIHTGAWMTLFFGALYLLWIIDKEPETSGNV